MDAFELEKELHRSMGDGNELARLRAENADLLHRLEKNEAANEVVVKIYERQIRDLTWELVTEKRAKGIR